uniref:Uncharacterized protein n=1 Tax=Romanomermis culicivorax TaxID=13658 RepID=A0A915L7P9_ROMCU
MFDIDIMLVKLLLIIFVDCGQNMLANLYFDGRDLATSATPCTFPVPTQTRQWHKCNLEPALAEKYRICDPESSIYLSQIESLITKLDQISHKHKSECFCDLHHTESDDHDVEDYNDHKIERRIRSTTQTNCWYKFSFAFVDRLRFPRTLIPDSIQYEDLCEKFGQSSINSESAQLHSRHWLNRKNVENYGQQFVNFLSKQWWPQETCEGNILILIVKNTRHILQVLVNLVTSIDDTLTLIYESFYSTPAHKSTKRTLIIRPPGAAPSLNYNHQIPNWALAVFAGCGLLLLLMALGVLWSKKRVRRPGLSNRKQVLRSDSRRWKVGFVGEFNQVVACRNDGNSTNVSIKRQTKITPFKIKLIHIGQAQVLQQKY